MAIIHVIALILIYDSSKGPSTIDLLDSIQIGVLNQCPCLCSRIICGAGINSIYPAIKV
jgi:hypothetical protein